MGVYAYCIVPSGHEPPTGLAGLQGSPVSRLSAGAVDVWVSRMDKPQPGVALLQEHNAVVEAAVTEQVTPVPLRFGQWLEDEAALLSALEEKAELYHAKLLEFAGCLEFGLRFLDPERKTEARDVHPSAATTGTAYMQALAAGREAEQKRQALARQVQQRVQQVLGDLTRAGQEEDLKTPQAVLTLSHLVARVHFDEYRACARQLRAEFPELRLLVSGPWPPYSFAA